MAVKVNTPQPQQAAQQKRPTIPFPRASRMKSNLSFVEGPITLGATSVPFGPIQIPANGYMRALTLQFDITSTGNTADVALSSDAPWNFLQQISVTTSSGDSLIVPIDGYALYNVIRVGAFGQNVITCDPQEDPNYNPGNTGTGSTGGSASFALRIPFEIDETTGFGSLPNLAANRSYFIQGIVNALSTVFTTPPDGTVTMTITAIADYWSVPNATNAQGDPQEVAPYGNGSFHVVQQQTIPVAAGSGIYQLNNVGNVIRQIICIYRDNSGVRQSWFSSAMPDVTELILNNDVMLYLTRKEFQRQMVYSTVSFVSSVQANGLEDGVMIFSGMSGNGQNIVDGHNSRNQLLPTLDATLLQIRGTNWSTAGTLQVITSSIVPTSAAALYAPHVY